MKKDVQLKNVKPYQDGYGHWFLKLVYTYEDEDGTHEFTYPKVDLPFDQASIPYHFEVPTDDNFFIELMTLEEVEEKLGYKVKIVSNKDTK